MSKRLLISLSVLLVIFASNTGTVTSTTSTIVVNVTHDTIYRNLLVKIVNATIFDDRSTAGAGDIYFTVTFDNNSYDSAHQSVNADPSSPANITVNFNINKNITLDANKIVVEVKDGGAGTLNNPDYLGNFTIDQIQKGTYSNWYNTTGGIGDTSYAYSEARVLVSYTLTDYSYLANPIITMNSPTAFFYKVGTSSHFLNFSLFDDNPNYFTLVKDNQLIYSGGWKNNNTILFNIDGLSVGNYNYTISAVDLYKARSTITVTVSVSSSGTESATGSSSSTNQIDTNRKLDYAGLELIALSIILPAIIVLKKRKKIV